MIDFNFGYNYNFTAYTEADYQGIQYVPWALYNKFMQQYYQDWKFKYSIQRENSSMNLDEYLALQSYYSQKLEETNDSKSRKKLQKKLDGLAEQLQFKSSGTSFVCWFQNGDQTSEVYYFPVMDSSNNAIVAADTRDISDNLMRATAKAVARFTGFTLRLWTREFIDANKKNDSSHPIYRGLKAYAELCLQKGLDYTDCDFSTPVDVLRQRYKEIGDLSEEQVIEERKVTALPFRTTDQALAWAKQQLKNWSERDIEALLNNARKEVGEGNSYAKLFYEKVLTNAKPAS